MRSIERTSEGENMRNRAAVFVSVLVCIALASVPAVAQHAPPPKDLSVEYSPYPEQTFPNRVYFGDTHLHTGFSTDAGMIGCTLSPEDAFRFSRGETVTSSNGQKVRLTRPLDFVVVADHSENLGLAPAIAESNPDLLKSAWGKEIHDMVKDGKGVDAYDAWLQKMMELDDPLADHPELRETYWRRGTEAADKYNEPGRFTAFIGFEWTSSPGGNNLHRNVVYRDGKDQAVQVIPISGYDTTDPEDLWRWMDDYEAKTGGKLLAIPHNGNLSNGLMFDDITLTSKKPYDRDYAQRRQSREPLYEITQMKGDGETHPLLSPNDEFADYERWDTTSFGPEPKTPDMFPREYARETFKRGLAYEQKLGVNPFKFGVIGSTDTHTGLPTTREENFFGKATPVEPSSYPVRFDMVIAGRPHKDPKMQQKALNTTAAGLAAVWSRENTREALWDAMARKEVYGTTGTRLLVRVFGGWDFQPADLDRSDFPAHGYAGGVPMGGDLERAPAGKAPVFLVRALRDADGANLDRIQIIKGWLDADGATHEKIYDIAASDGRTPGADGKLPPVGNTVDVENATYTNAIGEAFLDAYWKDPDFDAKERAFYYVRVIEIPTPRWTTIDAKVFGVEMPEGVPTSIQERAYTSPIWYTQ